MTKVRTRSFLAPSLIVIAFSGLFSHFAQAVANADETLGYPDVVRITIPGKSCSATTLSERVILTAAHCVDDYADGSIIEIGVWETTGTTTGFRVNEFFRGDFMIGIHPNHDIGGWGYDDIAVLTAQHGAVMPGITSAALYSGQWDPWEVGLGPRNPVRNTLVQIVGYGAGSTGNSCNSNPNLIKREGEAYIQGASKGPKGSSGPKKLFYASDSPSYSCSGDSGGAAILSGLQLGVISGSSWKWENWWDSSTSFTNHVVIVRPYLDWIRQTVQSHGVAMTWTELGYDYLYYDRVGRGGRTINHNRSLSDLHVIATH